MGGYERLYWKRKIKPKTHNKMDKDFELNARKDLVMRFIDKLDVVTTKDWELIPALIHFIESGDTNDFKEYNDFLIIKSEEDKKKELEKATRRIENIEKNITNIKQRFESAALDYEKWRKSFIQRMKDEPDPTKKRNIFSYSELRRFCNENAANGARALYVMDENGNLYFIEDAHFEGRKLLFRIKLGDKPCMPDRPPVATPDFERDDYDEHDVF